MRGKQRRRACTAGICPALPCARKQRSTTSTATGPSTWRPRPPSGTACCMVPLVVEHASMAKMRSSESMASASCRHASRDARSCAHLSLAGSCPPVVVRHGAPPASHVESDTASSATRFRHPTQFACASSCGLCGATTSCMPPQRRGRRRGGEAIRARPLHLATAELDLTARHAGRRARLRLPCSAAPGSDCCCSGLRPRLASSARGRTPPPLPHLVAAEANASEERGSTFFHRPSPTRHFASRYASAVGYGSATVAGSDAKMDLPPV